MVESKQMDKMYEYWCFFQVLSAVEKVTGLSRQRVTLKSRSDLGVYLGRRISLEYDWKGQPVQVFYDKEFGEKAESYSLEFRRDISLFWKENWHHFDAKYKNLVPESMKEDLEKMHVYKDAIQGSRTAMVLYPACGIVGMEFYSVPGTSLEGIGWMRLMIGEENDELVRWVRGILEEQKGNVVGGAIYK